MQVGLFDAPPAPPQLTSRGGMLDGLRWYQRAAVEAALAQFDSSIRSTLIEAATGTGKTQVFCALASAWTSGRVLILAHRTELISQAAERLEKMSGGFLRLGTDIGIEQADIHSCRLNRFVVGSVPSVVRRLSRLESDGGFGLIIVDEAHHTPARTYTKILDYFPAARVLGVTATPDRKDAKALGRVFEDVAYSYDIQTAIGDGFLVPILGESINIQGIDLDSVSKDRTGDLAAGQLDEVMCRNADAAVEKLCERVPPGTMQGIVFCPGVKSAAYTAHRLSEVVGATSASVDGCTPPEERASIFARFRRGQIQWLVNCQVATEGFDAPSASVIAMLRPTCSRAMYAQMIGRGTRVLPGIVDHLGEQDAADERRALIARSTKPNVLVLDFAGNNTKHSLITPTDILGGKYSDEERAVAKKIQEKEGGDILANLEVARAKIRELAAARARSTVHATVRRFDPFVALGYSADEERRFVTQYGRKPSTHQQRQALLAAGVARRDVAELSRHAANVLLAELGKRREKGLANIGQLTTLRKFGVESKDVTYLNAARAMAYISANGGRVGTVDLGALRRIVGGGDP